MGRVVHFEIHADDLQRAKGFYGEVFGWQFNAWGRDDYWMVTTGQAGTPGIDGGLVKRQGPRPAEGAPVNGFPCTIAVDDVKTSAARVRAMGGQVLVARAAVPGMGWLATCRDTEGNTFSLLQNDADAR